MSTIKILSCPFCGCKPKYMEGNTNKPLSNHTWGAWITCEGKRCHIQPQLGMTISDHSKRKQLKEAIIAAWNTRKG